VVTFDHSNATSVEDCPVGTVASYLKLIGTIHRDDDDGLLYKGTKVQVNKSTGHIIGNRVMVLKDGIMLSSTDMILFIDCKGVKKLYIATGRYKYKMKDFRAINNILRCVPLNTEATGTTYSSQYQFTKDATENVL